MEKVDNTLRMDWGNGQVVEHQIILERVIEMNNDVVEEEEEEYLVGEEIIPSTDVALTNSLDHIAAENLIYMAHDGHVQSMGDLIEEQVEQVENADYNEQQQFFECQEVTEEVISTDDWLQQQGEERVEIPVDQLITNNDTVIEEDLIVPLPTDQDEYTTLRPYPCDFCSRRFRKKASLMNHMVAHQNDRPHVCNLCGARYIRRCDLLNHLKIHAYSPEEGDDASEVDDNEPPPPISTVSRQSKKLTQKEMTTTNKRMKILTAGGGGGGQGSTKKKIKIETEDLNQMYMYADMQNYSMPAKLVERYPVTDPRKPFVCQHCGVGFAREKALQSHQKIHGGDSPFECETCSEMFWDPTELREHQRTQHQGQGAESEYEPENEEYGSLPEDASDSETDSKFGDYYCDICGLAFHRYDLMKRHSKQHIKREINDGDESGAHCCNVCGETFVEALDLLAHAEVHARFQPLKCLMCGESFIEESTIKEHIQNVHENDLTEFTCRLCGKLCRDSRTLMKHSWDHSKEKNHSCSKCGKNFLNKARLKRHMVSHRNKSVTCDVCSEEFPDGRTLMNHRHSHSNLTGRQFPCRECGKTFGSRSSQQIHIRIHTGERPYGCRYCWKAFADGGTLRKHERIHTGEKPYVCSVCPRAFNQRVVLREHIRSHHSSPDTKRGNSETPYYCQVCEELFATSVELIHHLIQHSDMNTALKRAPVMGPRKYKRRRKLKPHELERLKAQKSGKNTDEGSDYSNEEDISDEFSSYSIEKTTKSKNLYSSMPLSPQEDLSPTYTGRISATTNNNVNKNNRKTGAATAMDIQTLVDTLTSPSSPSNLVSHVSNVSTANNQSKATTGKGNNTTTSTTKKKTKNDSNQVSRPKMIHTQKTRVAVEDGKRKTKTMITRTTPGNQKTSGRRTKNTAAIVYDELIIPDQRQSTGCYSGDDDPLNEILAIKQEKINMKVEKTSDSEINSSGYSFEISRTSLNKYNSDIVNDLEEILRSPIKATNTTTTNYSSSVQSSYTNRNSRRYVMDRDDSTAEENVSQEDYDDDDDEEDHEEIVEEDNLVHQSGRPRRNVKRRFSIKTSPKRVVANKKTSPKSKSKNMPTSRIASTSSSPSVKKLGTIVDYGNPQVKQERELITTDDELYKCEMCSAVFTDRAQLLIHVPIHI